MRNGEWVCVWEWIVPPKPETLCQRNVERSAPSAEKVGVEVNPSLIESMQWVIRLIAPDASTLFERFILSYCGA